MVADRGSAEAAETVGRAGQSSDGHEELLDVISLARQSEPVFITQLPPGIDEE